MAKQFNFSTKVAKFGTNLVTVAETRAEGEKIGMRSCATRQSSEGRMDGMRDKRKCRRKDGKRIVRRMQRERERGRVTSTMDKYTNISLLDS